MTAPSGREETAVRDLPHGPLCKASTTTMQDLTPPTHRRRSEPLDRSPSESLSCGEGKGVYHVGGDITWEFDGASD
jgi:hypothetical protein